MQIWGHNGDHEHHVKKRPNQKGRVEPCRHQDSIGHWICWSSWHCTIEMAVIWWCAWWYSSCFSVVCITPQKPEVFKYIQIQDITHGLISNDLFASLQSPRWFSQFYPTPIFEAPGPIIGYEPESCWRESPREKPWYFPINLMGGTSINGGTHLWWKLPSNLMI